MPRRSQRKAPFHVPDPARPPLASNRSLWLYLTEWQEGGRKMTAEELSAIFSRHGVPVLGHQGANERLGGLIQVTEDIHVELAKHGSGAVVVKALGDAKFRYYALRTKIKDLIFDLVKAGAVVVH